MSQGRRKNLSQFINAVPVQGQNILMIIICWHRCDHVKLSGTLMGQSQTLIFFSNHSNVDWPMCDHCLLCAAYGWVARYFLVQFINYCQTLCNEVMLSRSICSKVFINHEYYHHTYWYELLNIRCSS